MGASSAGARGARARTIAAGIVGWLDSPLGMVTLFVTALVVRVAIAPSIGFEYDLAFFRQWVGRLHDVGLQGFYTGDLSRQYPPGYLYLLAGIGAVTRAPSNLVLKLPSIGADLALAWVAGVFAVRASPESLRARIPVRLLAVAAVLFNPALIAVSAGWGQVDAVTCLLVLAAFLVLCTDRSVVTELAALVLLAVAFSIKPQSAFVFPVVLYVLAQRHVLSRPRRMQLRGVAWMTLLGVVFLGTWLATGLPFGLGPRGLVAFYQQASNSYRLATVQAFNLWGTVGFQRGDSRGGSNVLAVFGVPAFYLGTVLFAVAVVYILWRLHLTARGGHLEARAVLLAAALMSLSAFVLLTRMHERYLLPAIVFMSPLVVWRPFRYSLAALSALFVVNLWYPFAYYNEEASAGRTLRVEPVFTWVFGSYLAVDTWQRKAWSALMVVMLVVLLVFGYRWIGQADDDASEDAAASR